MDDIRRTARRYKRQRHALDATYSELVPMILEARRNGASLRAVAEAAGLTFARIHQIEKAQHG